MKVTKLGHCCFVAEPKEGIRIMTDPGAPDYSGLPDKERNIRAILITHEHDVAEHARRVIFIKDGKVEKILALEMTVKVPEGMTEEDLARPIVVVKDFDTGKLEYEIYSYGEETVVVPVQEIAKKEKKSGMHELAAKQIENYLSDFRAKARVISDNKAEVYVPTKFVASIIGKGGKNIDQLEKELGIKIDVKEY